MNQLQRGFPQAIVYLNFSDFPLSKVKKEISGP